MSRSVSSETTSTTSPSLDDVFCVDALLRAMTATSVTPRRTFAETIRGEYLLDGVFEPDETDDRIASGYVNEEYERILCEMAGQWLPRFA